MRFETAFLELKKLAKKKYCSIRYEVHQHSASNSKQIVEINCYIDGYGFTKNYKTFADALKEMKNKMYPDQIPQDVNPDISDEEQPD